MRNLNAQMIQKISHIDGINVYNTSYSIRIRLVKSFEISEEEGKSEGQSILKKGNKVTQVLNVIIKTGIRELDPKIIEIGLNSKFIDLRTEKDV